MKIVQTHIQCYDGSPPGRKEDSHQDARYEQEIFSFKQKFRNDEIIDDVIICRDENQVAEFDSHCFGNTYRVRPENDHPKTVNGRPEKNMGKIGFD
jgi:hypothetical protein